MNIEQLRILLASASPRRRQLISELGLNVSVLKPIDVDESFDKNMPAESVPLFLSQKKSLAYRGLVRHKDEVLVTADTVVIIDGIALGKPKNQAEAKEMLRLLSGRQHSVVSGVTLYRKGFESITFGTETKVSFSELTEYEIDYYVDRFNPIDKAGAYGIQEWIGYIGVAGIEGDYYNVVGLPLHDLYQQLKNII